MNQGSVTEKETCRLQETRADVILPKIAVQF